MSKPLQILPAHLAVAILLAVTPLVATAASFDCNRAATAVETAICKDSTVSAADDELASLYAKAKAADPSVTVDQAQWLTDVRDRCADAECLANVYLDRISVLEKKIGDVRELPRVVEPLQTPSVSTSPPPEEDNSRPSPQEDNSSKAAPSDTSKDNRDWVAVLILVAGFVYLLPTIVAFNRKHEHRWAILIANIFLAPTVIGWVIVLAFASGLIGGTAAITLAALSDQHGREKRR